MSNYLRVSDSILFPQLILGFIAPVGLFISLMYFFQRILYSQKPMGKYDILWGVVLIVSIIGWEYFLN